MGETNSPSVAHVGYDNPWATEGESIYIYIICVHVYFDYIEIYFSYTISVFYFAWEDV